MRKKVIVLDFDGCIHHYTSGYTGIVPKDPPSPGALEFVRWLREKKFTIVVLSARIRDDKGRQEIENWLIEHNFPDGIIVTNIKPPAVLYVDDRGWRFDGDWNEVKSFLEENDLNPGTWVEESWGTIDF